MRSGCVTDLTRVGVLLVALVGAAGLMGAKPAAAQVSVYGEVTGSKITNLVSTKYLYGPTIGISDNLGTKHGFTLGGDLRGNFLGGAQRFDQLALGPKVGRPVGGFMPYGEFLVGFARYNDGQGTRTSGTTDGMFQVVAGLDRKLTPHFDVRIFEYTYEQYYALGGQFNPKLFSAGVVYHLGGR